MRTFVATLGVVALLLVGGCGSSGEAAVRSEPAVPAVSTTPSPSRPAPAGTPPPLPSPTPTLAPPPAMPPSPSAPQPSPSPSGGRSAPSEGRPTATEPDPASAEPQPEVDEDCPDVLFLGARGSGEGGGLGLRVGAVEEAFRTAVGTELDVVTEPITYGAPPIDWALTRSAEYVEASRAGARTLATRLLASAQACPTTEVVLVGYSSGAMVVHMALQDPATAPALGVVADVELLADPMRSADDATAGSTAGPYAGIASLFRDVDPAPVPAAVAAVTSSRCLAGDVICAYGPEVDLVEAVRVHLSGYQSQDIAGPSGETAARRVTSK